MAVGGAAGFHDVIVYVTTNMAFMNDKEVEYLIKFVPVRKIPLGSG